MCKKKKLYNSRLSFTVCTTIPHTYCKYHISFVQLNKPLILTFPFQNLLQNWGSQCFRQHWKYLTLMQTLLLGHVPVLSQMTEAHADFLMMKRSVSECMYYHTIVSEWSMQLYRSRQYLCFVVLKKLPSCFSHQRDYLTSTPSCYWWLHKCKCFH